MRTKAATLLASRYTWDAIAATTLGVYDEGQARLICTRP